MTGIEWVLNPDGSRGVTLNSKTGCRNHTPEGLCLGGLFPCYAFKLAHGRLKQRYLANGLVACDYEGGEEGSDANLKAAFNDPFYPRWWPERLAQISKLKKPTGIFLDDMSDWMGDYWPREWTMAELQMMRDNPQHRIYTLTKQPQNLIKFSPFPENCWVGVTATNHKMFVEACIELGDIQAKVKYISLEPLLSWGDYPADQEAITQWAKGLTLYGINWLIPGACTGTLPEMVSLCDRYPFGNLAVMRYGNRFTAQPRIEDLREIVEAADKAGVKVFLKDNLVPLIAGEGTPEGLFYKDCRLRQEMPNV